MNIDAPGALELGQEAQAHFGSPQAVLDAPRQRLSTSPPRSTPAPALHATPEFTDALGLDGQPFCGETGLHRGGRRAPTGQ